MSFPSATFTLCGKAYTAEALLDLTDGCIPAFQVCDEFASIKDLADPITASDEIAQAIKSVAGTIIVDGEYFYHQGVMITIMDDLKFNNDELDPVLCWIFLKAFSKAGFKYAMDCDPNVLRGLIAQAGYEPYTHYNFDKRHAADAYDTYDYAAIKNDSKIKLEDLVAEVYHPRRISKWLDAGYSIETILG